MATESTAKVRTVREQKRARRQWVESAAMAASEAKHPYQLTHLALGDSPAAWRRAGFDVDRAGRFCLGRTQLRCLDVGTPGFVGWRFDDIADDPGWRFYNAYRGATRPPSGEGLLDVQQRRVVAGIHQRRPAAFLDQMNRRHPGTAVTRIHGINPVPERAHSLHRLLSRKRRFYPFVAMRLQLRQINIAIFKKASNVNK